MRQEVMQFQLMQQEFNLNMQIKGVEQQGLKDRELQREDAKSQRISQRTHSNLN